MKSTMPLIRACLSRSSTGALAPGEVLAPSSFLPFFLTVSANSISRSVGVGPAVEQHVLDALEQVLGDLLVDLRAGRR